MFTFLVYHLLYHLYLSCSRSVAGSSTTKPAVEYKAGTMTKGVILSRPIFESIIWPSSMTELYIEKKQFFNGSWNLILRVSEQRKEES